MANVVIDSGGHIATSQSSKLRIIKKQKLKTKSNSKSTTKKKSRSRTKAKSTRKRRTKFPTVPKQNDGYESESESDSESDSESLSDENNFINLSDKIIHPGMIYHTITNICRERGMNDIEINGIKWSDIQNILCDDNDTDSDNAPENESDQEKDFSALSNLFINNFGTFGEEFKTKRAPSLLGTIHLNDCNSDSTEKVSYLLLESMIELSQSISITNDEDDDNDDDDQDQDQDEDIAIIVENANANANADEQAFTFSSTSFSPSSNHNGIVENLRQRYHETFGFFPRGSYGHQQHWLEKKLGVVLVKVPLGKGRRDTRYKSEHIDVNLRNR